MPEYLDWYNPPSWEDPVHTPVRVLRNEVHDLPDPFRSRDCQNSYISLRNIAKKVEKWIWPVTGIKNTFVVIIFFCSNCALLSRDRGGPRKYIRKNRAETQIASTILGLKSTALKNNTEYVNCFYQLEIFMGRCAMVSVSLSRRDQGQKDGHDLFSHSTIKIFGRRLDVRCSWKSRRARRGSRSRNCLKDRFSGGMSWDGSVGVGWKISKHKK